MAIEVRPIADGYYNGRRRKGGPSFPIANEKDFSAKWMKKVEAKAGKPAKVEDEAGDGEQPPPKPTK